MEVGANVWRHTCVRLLEWRWSASEAVESVWTRSWAGTILKYRQLE